MLIIFILKALINKTYLLLYAFKLFYLISSKKISMKMPLKKTFLY